MLVSLFLTRVQLLSPLCRYVILHKDFEKAYKSTIKKQTDEFEFYK